MATVLPGMIFFWFFWASIAGVIAPYRGSRKWQFDWRAFLGIEKHSRQDELHFLQLWSIYILLPILLRGASWLANWMGLEAISSLLYEHRYISLIYVLCFVFIIVVIMVVGQSIWMWAKDIWGTYIRRNQVE